MFFASKQQELHGSPDTRNPRIVHTPKDFPPSYRFSCTVPFINRPPSTNRKMAGFWCGSIQASMFQSAIFWPRLRDAYAGDFRASSPAVRGSPSLRRPSTTRMYWASATTRRRRSSSIHTPSRRRARSKAAPRIFLKLRFLRLLHRSLTNLAEREAAASPSSNLSPPTTSAATRSSSA